jgi:hypothetical protein
MWDSNSEMSLEIIPLKSRVDLRRSSRILATETTRVWAAAPGIKQLGAGFCRDLVIRAIEEALVDRGARHKTVHLDGVGALDLDRFELRVLNDEVLALGHLVTTGFVLGSDRLAGLFIDELLAQAIAGGLVDLPEGDALGRRAGRMERRNSGFDDRFRMAL